MEEQTGQISRTVILFASPFGCKVHLGPACQFCRDLTIQCITVKAITSVADQTLLIKEVSTQYISQLICTTADADIVFVCRSILAVEFSEPVCIGKGSSVVLELVVIRIHCCTIVFRSTRICEFSVHILLDV